MGITLIHPVVLSNIFAPKKNGITHSIHSRWWFLTYFVHVHPCKKYSHFDDQRIIFGPTGLVQPTNADTPSGPVVNTEVRDANLCVKRCFW